MKKKKLSGSGKSLPSSTPISSLIAIRGYGILDLKKYLVKIKKNISVFNEAIAKENQEMKRILGMIKVLENDIKDANDKLHH